MFVSLIICFHIPITLDLGNPVNGCDNKKAEKGMSGLTETMTDQTPSDKTGGKWLGGSDHLLMTYCTNTNMELFKETNMDISHIEIWNRSDAE